MDVSAHIYALTQRLHEHIPPLCVLAPGSTEVAESGVETGLF